jgi:hypothetical protein
VPTLTFDVAADNDNAFGRYDGTTFGAGGTTLQVRANTGTSRSRVAFRFVNVNLPAGATIDNAQVRVTGNSLSNSDMNATIGFELAPDGADFATSGRNTATGLTGLTRTSSTPTWVDSSISTGVSALSPDLSVALQEVVDNGFVENDAVVVLIDGVTSVNQNCTVRAYGFGSDFPRLIIDYTPPNLKGWSIGISY